MASIFRLRKRVFADGLNWDVPVHGDQEYDDYDRAGASYLVWCSDDRETLYGVVRLMTTDGPTLLHDVFWATHDRDDGLIGDHIWEGTRMCVDKAMIARDHPDVDCGRAFSLLLIALCEAALACGIDRLVSNFEPVMARIYQRAGVRMQMHGRADGYGRRPVCCASFEVSSRVLHQMRARIGISLPLLMPQPHVIARSQTATFGRRAASI
ncbi:MAG: acyl-homoserine-lactone synthase [Paracoccus sp. (in: a-proteobacteria)]|uniref:acyl-homoserine-lactone synthase n=1 Tax=Paracoccus sp. TaxID=267 RepID=UPI0026DFDA3B|nr:acyl-homoserine-lactone synthase [Paracoccus sp. (in: a-proteobacteria)]MDO5614531.1 acyl-homoserine-lactone synthase [Paracoccus sp. (in: a-proteobacteria)]